MTILRATLATVLLCTAAACSKNTEHKDYSNVPGGHAHSHAPAKHAHTAPHGGTLVEIGDHAYNVELLRDAATGKLTAWFLDGHAENFVRLKAPSIEIVATVAGAKQTLVLAAVANPATNEKVGDTSQFEVTADWLKTTATFDAVIPAVTIKDTPFTAIAFNFPKGGN
jgi:hypothetical protein